MKSRVDEWILARDIIDMIIEYQEHIDVLDYLEGFTFSLDMIHEGSDEDIGAVDWGEINTLCHLRVHELEDDGYSQRDFDQTGLDKLQQKYQMWIDRHSKRVREGSSEKS